MLKSKWEAVYQRFNRVEKLWPCRLGTAENQVFRHAIDDRKSMEQVIREANRLKVALPNRSTWDEVKTLKEEIRPVTERAETTKYIKTDTEGYFEDVYQVAIWLKILNRIVYGWAPSPDYRYVYRGQNKEYPIIPKIYREAFDDIEIKKRLIKLSQFVYSLQIELPHRTEEQLIAITQHYSDIAKLGTWMIDFTWDPYVALFFSSLNAKEEDFGVIFYISQSEWNEFSNYGQNILGDIRIIEIPDIKRISAQRALFINTSHPDLLEQYVPHSIYYKQHKDMIFEDPIRSPPITREFLLPDDDPMIKIVQKINPSSSVKILDSAKYKAPIKPLNEYDYLSIVLSWCKRREFKVDQKTLELIVILCDFYSRLQSNRDKINVTLRSLNRLESAALSFTLKEGLFNNWNDCLSLIFINRAFNFPEQKNILIEIAKQLETDMADESYFNEKLKKYDDKYPNTRVIVLD